VLAALDMALAQRRPTAVIHHSDQGTSIAFRGSAPRPRRAWPSSIFIEGWCSPRRRHSALGYRSPNDFERSYALRGIPESAELST
jgi:putative transposase